MHCADGQAPSRQREELVPAPSARSQLPSPGAASPNRWAYPPFGLGHPKRAADSKARAPALRRAQPWPPFAAPRGGTGCRDLCEQGQARGLPAAPSVPRNEGPSTSESDGPSAIQGTSALASRQEGIFPKRNRFIRSLVRLGSHATEKPQPSASAPALFAEDPDVQPRCWQRPGPRGLPRWHGSGFSLP